MKNNALDKMMDSKVADRLEKLEQLDPGSDEYEKTMKELEAFMKLRSDCTKEKNDNFFRVMFLGVDAAGVILPLIFYAFWMKKGFQFEEKGTFTSTTFRGLFNRFRPTK